MIGVLEVFCAFGGSLGPMREPLLCTPSFLSDMYNLREFVAITSFLVLRIFSWKWNEMQVVQTVCISSHFCEWKLPSNWAEQERTRCSDKTIWWIWLGTFVWTDLTEKRFRIRVRTCFLRCLLLLFRYWFILTQWFVCLTLLCSANLFNCFRLHAHFFFYSQKLSIFLGRPWETFCVNLYMNIWQLIEWLKQQCFLILHCNLFYS